MKKLRVDPGNYARTHFATLKINYYTVGEAVGYTGRPRRPATSFTCKYTFPMRAFVHDAYIRS